MRIYKKIINSTPLFEFRTIKCVGVDLKLLFFKSSSKIVFPSWEFEAVTQLKYFLYLRRLIVYNFIMILKIWIAFSSFPIIRVYFYLKSIVTGWPCFHNLIETKNSLNISFNSIFWKKIYIYRKTKDKLILYKHTERLKDTCELLNTINMSGYYK